MNTGEKSLLHPYFDNMLKFYKYLIYEHCRKNVTLKFHKNCYLVNKKI